MTESVRQQCVYTMPETVSLHLAMSALCGKQDPSSSNAYFGPSRRERDTADVMTLISWLNENNPFDPEVVELKSLSSGLIAKPEDNLDCDDVFSTGVKIKERMDGIPFIKSL